VLNFTEPVSFGLITVTLAVIFIIIAMGIFAVKKAKK
jgi:hypothetical protein